MSAPVELLACESCGGADRDARGLTRGQRLLEQLRDAASARAVEARERRDEGALGHGDDVRIAGTRCLWNCKRSCSLHVRGPGRAGYVLGDLPASEEMARALLDWTSLYAASDDGAVPFKTWPALLRGHFVCRVPAGETHTPED